VPRKIWQPCSKGVVTRNSDFVSRDRICVVRLKLKPFNLSYTTKYCVVRLNLCTQYDQNWSLSICVVRPNFVSCDWICVVRTKLSLSNCVVRTKLSLSICVVWPKLKPYNLCRTTKFCVTLPNFMSHDTKLVFCVNRPLAFLYIPPLYTKEWRSSGSFLWILICAIARHYTVDTFLSMLTLSLCPCRQGFPPSIFNISDFLWLLDTTPYYQLCLHM
jgi:hypothetical protein